MPDSPRSPAEIAAAHQAEAARAFADKPAEIAARAAKQPNLTCFVETFPLALVAIARVHDYSRGPLVKGDYLPSLLRHLFGIGEHPDHLAGAAWNALAALELRERAKSREG